MKILNYGAGAVGMGISSCLLKSGASVHFVGRPQTVAALNEHGLKRHGIFGEFSAPPDTFQAYSSLKDIPISDYDFILVSTKSFDSRAAAQDMAGHPKLFTPQTKIVLCQNGWGNAEIFAEFFPTERIYSARVITGFTRTQPNEVTITVHADDIRVGSLFKNDLACLKDLCQKITSGGIPCQVTEDVAKDLWAKMLYNCALNPLGAILDVSYGELAEQETSRAIMNQIIEEIYQVMRVSGYQTHWPAPKDYQKIFYSSLVPATAKHKSSTLQSLKSGKKTEVDALTGVVVELSQKHRIPTPVNAAVYGMIKFIEWKNKKAQPAR